MLPSAVGEPFGCPFVCPLVGFPDADSFTPDVSMGPSSYRGWALVGVVNMGSGDSEVNSAEVSCGFPVRWVSWGGLGRGVSSLAFLWRFATGADLAGDRFGIVA